MNQSLYNHPEIIGHITDSATKRIHMSYGRTCPPDFRSYEIKIKNKIIKVGRSAPSRGNSQPWHFIVVTDEKMKSKLTSACYGQELIRNAAFCIVVSDKIDPRKTNPDRTSELVTAGAFAQEVKDFADHVMDDWKLSEMKVDAALNSAIPATLMSIAALDFQLGSCWVKLANDDAVLKVVCAQEGFYHTGIIEFGYPDQSPSVRPRCPYSSMVSKNKFGTVYPALE